ncbi:MAG: diaminopimelate epimerase [Stackebrandtia sp.]
MEFAKGHGTGNDFVVVADVDGARPLTARQIAGLCDWRTGVGGDGLLRVVRASKHPDGVDQADQAEWFMDYYNADGSLAEMCGNGVRVYARYLLAHGLAEGPRIPVATRAGVRAVTVEDDQLSVDMGPTLIGDAAEAVVDGVAYPGVRASTGNPHLVCRADDLDALNLTVPPLVDPKLFGDGVNVEFIRGRAPAIQMRVHERGVGETASCGTGACAAAAVALDGPGACAVDVPGGRLTVTVAPETTTLTGPAVLVAEGRTSLA